MAQVKEGVSLTHAYKHHKTKRKGKEKNVIAMNIFKEICYTFNKLAVQKAIEGFHVQFPHKMGHLRIVRKKSDVEKLAIDFQATKEHGVTIYHDNRHSDGWHGRWSWPKPNLSVKNMIHYSFEPTRDMKAMITKAFRVHNGYKKYMAL